MKRVFEVQVLATYGVDEYGRRTYWIESAAPDVAGRKAVTLGKRQFRNGTQVAVRVVKLEEIGTIDART